MLLRCTETQRIPRSFPPWTMGETLARTANAPNVYALPINGDESHLALSFVFKVWLVLVWHSRTYCRAEVVEARIVGEIRAPLRVEIGEEADLVREERRSMCRSKQTTKVRIKSILNGLSDLLELSLQDSFFIGSLASGGIQAPKHLRSQKLQSAQSVEKPSRSSQSTDLCTEFGDNQQRTPVMRLPRDQDVCVDVVTDVENSASSRDSCELVKGANGSTFEDSTPQRPSTQLVSAHLV